MKSNLIVGTALQNGKYKVIKVLGQGGFGITYLAYFPILKVNVAIKEFFISGYCVRQTGLNGVTTQAISTDKFGEFRDKFISEARTLAKFRHNNIVRVTDIFEENNTAYFVMDYVEGKTLNQLVKVKGKLAEEESVNYIAQVAEAINEVHEAGLLHRDIKPENIIITPGANAVLIDFGTAKNFVQQQSKSTALVFTPAYAAIEQFSERKPKGRYTDIYGLGGTFYYCLTAEEPVTAIERIQNEVLQEPDKINKTVSNNINQMVMKCLNIQAEERYQNVDEFLDDFRRTINPVNPFSKPSPILEYEQKGLILSKNKRGNYGFINQQNEIIIPHKYYHAREFKEERAAVSCKDGFFNSELWGYIDTSGKLIIDCKYENALSFSEGLAAVQITYGFMTTSKYGFINKEGQLMIGPFKAFLVRSFMNGKALIESWTNYYIDKQGQRIK